ncbi:MAG: SDR family oxidoreductase, partial [Acidimicrobiales bacterium]|nr:SDR family oxidoreductase [Acidimicrobiales bacterium]
VCAANIVAYKTSKAALNAYTHALATGNARYGIRANAIMPGLMNTPMAIEGYVTAGHDREQLVARRNAQVPLGRTMGDAWDVANAALFLASDEARFITGVILPVDGGQSAMIG